MSEGWYLQAVCLVYMSRVIMLRMQRANDTLRHGKPRSLTHLFYLASVARVASRIHAIRYIPLDLCISNLIETQRTSLQMTLFRYVQRISIPVVLLSHLADATSVSRGFVSASMSRY